MNIIKTIPGDSNFHWFHKLPQQIYSLEKLPNGGKNIDEDHLHACYVYVEHGEVLGRFALYQNFNLQYQNRTTASIGYYESINKQSIANSMLTYAQEEARKLGAQYLIGGMNGSTWNNYRLSTHHDAPNFLLEPYHHLYYNNHFQESGFSIMAKYFSSLDDQIVFDHPKILQRKKELLQQGLKMQPINLDNYEKELERLYPFVTNAFKTNFLYSSISWLSFKQKYMAAKQLIQSPFVLLAEDAEGKIIGLFFCYPDYFYPEEKRLVIKTIARDPTEKWRGLGQVMANHIYRQAKKESYQSIIHAFLIEQGTSTSTSKKFSGTVYKNYVLYGKAI